MSSLVESLTGASDWPQILHTTIKLLSAALLGGILGFEREQEGKAAGLRTHMLVALGSAVFVVAPLELGVNPADIGRVVQGVAAGIGFIGAGTILKRPEHTDVQGLTTAAGLWLTAAVGMAVGLGRMWLPAVATGLALGILLFVGYVERKTAASPKR